VLVLITTALEVAVLAVAVVRVKPFTVHALVTRFIIAVVVVALGCLGKELMVRVGHLAPLGVQAAVEALMVLAVLLGRVETPVSMGGVEATSREALQHMGRVDLVQFA
jgi:hypothetical protein